MSTLLVIAAVVAAWTGIAALVICICKCAAAGDRTNERIGPAAVSRARREYRTGSGWKA